MEKEKLIPNVYAALANGYMDKFEREGWRDSLYYIVGNLEDKFYLSENMVIDVNNDFFKYLDEIDGKFPLKDHLEAISQDYEKEHYQWLEDGYNRWATHKNNQEFFNEWFKLGKEIWPKHREVIEKEKLMRSESSNKANNSERGSMRKRQCSSCGMSICEDDYIVHGCCPVCDENF